MTRDIEAYRRVLAAGRAGDPTACAAMRTVAGCLGVGVVLLVNTFNSAALPGFFGVIPDCHG